MNTKHLLLTLSLGLGWVLTAHPVAAYEADNASTPTLWAITDPAERVAADKKRRGDYYANRIKFFLEENATTVTKGGAVFIGDSITNGFPIDVAFAGRAVYNRGIGGDRIEGVLERLDCCVIVPAPSQIHVMIGANDVLTPDEYRDGNLGPGYDRLLRAIKDVAPQARITAYTMLPMNESVKSITKTCLEDIVTANKQLRDVCEKLDVTLVDMYADFATPAGEFRKGLTDDGVHLNLLGFLTWLDHIATTFDGVRLYPVWKNLAPRWATFGADTISITGCNEARTLNSLILYRNTEGTTPRATTGTPDDKGAEIIVENDTVTSMTTKGNMAMPPPPGYVISAVGAQREWLLRYAQPGAKIVLAPDSKTITRTTAKATPTNHREWYDEARAKLMNKLCVQNISPKKLKLYEACADALQPTLGLATDDGIKAIIEQIEAIDAQEE